MEFLGNDEGLFHPSAFATSLLHMRWTFALRACRMMLSMAVATGAAVVIGCGEEPEVAPEDRIVRVPLAPADREAIMDARFDSIRTGIIEIRRLEGDRPDPAQDPGAYAAHADQVDERTRQVIFMMAADGWSRDERRLMQRVLRFATIADLDPDGPPDSSSPDSSSPGSSSPDN